MKLDRFRELCEKHYANARGDLSAMWLTEDSFSELYEDILVNRAGPVSIVHPHWDLINPVTRTLVPVKTTNANHDWVHVHYRGGMKETVDLDVPGS